MMSKYRYQEWHLATGDSEFIEWNSSFVSVGMRERQDGTRVICFLIPKDHFLLSNQTAKVVKE